jgi:uncharacterized protein involved in exopolysaccharide biosynthesis
MHDAIFLPAQQIQNQFLSPQRTGGGFPTARDLLAVIFRNRRLALLSFVGILACWLIITPTLSRYRANLKILVRHERVDPVFSADESPRQGGAEITTEEELHSEAELLKTEDLLRNVVLASGLLPSAGKITPSDLHQQKALARAVRELQGSLEVTPILKSDLIDIKYESATPQVAEHVLNTLARLYLEKHLEVHRTPGQYNFFQQEAERYRQDLESAEAKLAGSNLVGSQLLRDMTLQKLAEFNATLEQMRAAIRETQQRISILELQQSTVPSRLTTQVSRSDNPQVLQQLKSTLLDLELKRAQLLTKYQPTYLPVREVEQEIADTRAMLSAEQSAPLRGEVTDQNPTHAWIRSELAKARADLEGLQARAVATERTVATYNTNTGRLQQNSIVEQDLMRAAKAAEDNYLLYRRKGEESRISEALDEKRILNVAVAQSASLPVLPVHSKSYYALLGFAIACLLTLGVVFAADYLDPTYRTPEEVTHWLELPVLAAVPRSYNRYTFNGNHMDGCRRQRTPAWLRMLGALNRIADHRESCRGGDLNHAADTSAAPGSSDASSKRG